MLRYVLGGTGAVLAVGLVALNLSDIGRIYLPSGTGIVAKQTCSLTFVSGLDSDYAKDIYVDPLLGDANSLISVSVDEADQEVTASALGFFWTARAVYREGLGCTLVHNSRDFEPDLTIETTPFEPLQLDTAQRDANFDVAALETAIAEAFDDPANDRRDTLGVAVLHQGRLVAEQYGPRASRETRFHGWSMTKSFAATLAGAMTQRGELDIYATGNVPALAEAGREEITVDHLLRMTGGLAIAEYNDGTDPNSQMLFTQTDMARFAATRERLHAPGDHWEYMSGNTVLASHAMQSRLGETTGEQITGIRARLFEPLNMGSAIIEVDQSGTFQGSSYMYATAHDWARLAQLYLDDGMAGDTRILPETWWDVVAEETPGSDGEYGLGFWLPYEGDGLPPETIMMSGFQGQWAYIMPEQELVIVRFGATNGTNSRSGSLARGVLAAYSPSSD